MKIVPMNVELVDVMGSDLSVVNAARVSFNKVSKLEHHIHLDKEFDVLSEKDAKLINYLAKHNHWTPFAHAFASFRIKAPIFVARQLVKHQVGLAWNEVSRRYVDEEPEFWFPEEWRSRPEGSVKQGSGEKVIDVSAFHVEDAVNFQLVYQYNNLLAAGVAPEQARMVLPQNTMTEWIWSGSLAAFCRVCKLRLDPHAQQETRELVEGIKALLEPKFPVAFKALTNYEN